MKKKFTDKGTNVSFLSKPERKFINFMLPKFPKWITPDLLTFLGFLASLLIVGGYYLAKTNKNLLFLVSLFIIIHWFADSHDGGLARYRKQSRPRYGYYIDHILDFITICAIFIGLILYGLKDLPVFLLLFAYLTMFCHSLLYCGITNKFNLSFFKFSPTEGRLFIIFLNIGLFYNLDLIIEKAFYIISIAIFVFALFLIIKTCTELNKLDTK